jgi:integrase
MPHLSPQTLTTAEQQALLRGTASHPRDHLLFSLALGTGLRLAEIVGLNVGDVYFPNGTPRVRIRLRPTIAKNGRAGDVFLPDGLMPKLERFWSYDAEARAVLELQGSSRGGRRPIFSPILLPIRPADLQAEGAGGLSGVAAQSGI